METTTKWVSEEDLKGMLRARACAETPHVWRGGRFWMNNLGEPFTVPPPPDAQGYPMRLVIDILNNGRVTDPTRH